MNDTKKTRRQPLNELADLRERVAELEALEARHAEVEQALRESEERFRILFEHSPDAIVLLDPNDAGMSWPIVDCNEATCRMNGYAREELVGQSIDILHGQPEDPAKRAAYLERLRHEGTITAETLHRRKDGIFFSVQFSTSLVTLNGRERVLGIDRDITARVRAEEELRRYREHLEELVRERTAELEATHKALESLSRVKDEFITSISHELRTPITNIKLYHHLLATNPDRDKSTPYLVTLRRETARLERLVEDLLDISRLDREQPALNLSSLDLNALIDSHISYYEPLARERGLSLSFDRAANLPSIQADRALLGQAVGVLLANAINYTPSGGQVMVRTHMRHADGQHWVGFSVCDSGPGIPPEERPRLFERFFRGKVGRDSGVPGIGLGLAIANEIVDRHQGRIEVSSQPGQGATFSVWLPQGG